MTIVPWPVNEKESLNLENGICLSPLYDKAFDKGLIGINENYEILLSSNLKKKYKYDFYEKYFSHLQNEKISLPQKYSPKKEFLKYHLNVIFENNISY
jgi:putative restriction endonuclease